MANVVQVNDRIWQIQTPFLGDGMVMLYLLRGGKTALVDTGIATSPLDDVRPALKDMGLDLRDIDVVLNTHGHHDHLGGNGNLKEEAPDAAIHLHADDKPFAESHEYHHTFMTDFLNQLGHSSQVPIRQAVFVKSLSRDAGVDRVLHDGDRVDLGSGLELQVIHTPGHTPGSVCYYWEAEKLVLSGDAVQGRGSRVGGWPLYFHASTYMSSIGRLLDVPMETLCLGHGFHSGVPLNTPTRRGAEARQILEDSAATSKAIDEAVRERVKNNPQASNFDIAQGVTMDLLSTIPTMLDPVLKLPGSAATLWAHIREAREAA